MSSSTLAAPRALRRRSRLAAQLVSIPVVAAIVLVGVWVAGGVISNDFRLSMVLTAAWFALSGLACVAVAIRQRTLRVPVLAAYLVTAAAIGTYLGLATLRDRVVHETVVTGTPIAAAPAPPAANVELARGRFRSGEHATSGRAAVVRTAGGTRYLTLTSFATSPGPDLRVRLVPRASTDGGAPDAIDLGGLKGNRGDQQYRLPSGTNVAGSTVVIWCRAFSVDFGSARLQRA
jgi:Electron transfer DM13